jgi:catechol 2,3-dioxygenase-like lactoylglutathione lyase family enzyme
MVEPGLRGLTEVVITVSDFDRHRALYCDLLGFEVRAHGSIDPDVATALWGVPVGRAVEAMQLGAGGSDSGLIRLLRVDGGPSEAVRPTVLDFGLFDFDVYTMDMPRAYAQLTAAGYPWTAPPQLWSPDGHPEIEVLEGWCLAPDGVNLVLNRPFQRKGSKAWEADPDRPYTEVTASVAVVADLEREAAFWLALGLRIGVDFTLRHPAIDRFLQLPEGSVLRMLLLTARGSGPARVELITPLSGSSGLDRTRQQRPGRVLGLCGWALRVGDLDAALDAVYRGGGQCVAGPLHVETPIHGRARVATVETPAGAHVELSQPHAE